MLKLMCYFYGLLVKWSNTLPSQGNIHGFKSHTGYHLLITRLYLVFLYFKCYTLIGDSMKKVLIIGLFVLLICGCQSNSMKSNGKIKCKDIETILAYENNPKLIDVRTKEEYDEYHLDKAINIAYENIVDDIKNIENITLDTPIIVYCKSGTRSEKAYNSLKSAGYKHIYDLGSINNCN